MLLEVMGLWVWCSRELGGGRSGSCLKTVIGGHCVVPLATTVFALLLLDCMKR